MKILLIQPPIQDFYQTDIRLQPIGLAYLKASLKETSPRAETRIIDFHQGWGRKTVPIPPELSYLKPYYGLCDKSPFRLFHQYYHFGASYSQIGDVVSAIDPDLVGISSLFTPYYREALETARAVKERCRARVIMGGSHVSCAPYSVLGSPWVDGPLKGPL